MTVFVLGDQLTRQVGPVADRDEPVLLIEAHEFARKLPYHPHKLTLVFAAMRAFRDALREAGRTVYYHEVETFREGFQAHFGAHPSDELVMMDTPRRTGTRRLATLIEAQGGTLSVVENELFLCSHDRFDEWASDRSQPYRHEDFYRMMRRETGYLMDGDHPVGGEWNFDDRNQEFPGRDHEPPEPPTLEPDRQTQMVADWVRNEFTGGYDSPPYGGDWADPEPFRWPVTRQQALSALDAFVENRLASFGPYQDAMLDGHWAMYHSLLAAPLNIGLLHPAEVVEAVIAGAREDPEVPIESVEGFVRQVIGWREFMRGVYCTVPELASANQFDVAESLPDCYWTGETQMACLGDAIDGVRKRGYSHHIQRLMILSNFGLLYGVEPAQLNRWFHAGYVDAYHWVTTPNVVEMGLFGAGVFATKPYAASANYIDRMSNYCADCAYDKNKTLGEDACPFNTLYWEFLDRNEPQLRSNHRMGLVYSHLDNKDRKRIRTQAKTVRERMRNGNL